MVKHVVTFRLKGTPAERHTVASAFKDALLALPEQIEVLRHMEVGLNESPTEDWDLTLVATVDTLADVSLYSNHPAHLAAASIIKDHKADRACVDYSVY